MEFNEYQSLAKQTAVYPHQIKNLYSLLGLFGEVAETIEKARENYQIIAAKSGVVVVNEVRERLDRIDEIFATVIPLGQEMEKIKKHLRKYGFGADIETIYTPTEQGKENVKKELGDLLWYIAATCEDYGFTMEDVAVTNYNKLKDRMERNVITGSGDNR